jgi:hypothetical protein
MDNAREDFDCWNLLLTLANREWGTPEAGGGARFNLAARAAANDTDDAQAIVKMRQVCFAQREIHNLITQVQQAVKDEAKKELVPVTVDYSRRGNL